MDASGIMDEAFEAVYQRVCYDYFEGVDGTPWQK